MRLLLSTEPPEFRKPVAVVVFALICLFVWTPACRAERVRDLHQNITLGRSGQLAVDETITVDFGKAGQPYFYRRIPTLYKRSGKLCQIMLFVKSVSDEQGKPLAYTSKDMQGYANIVVGDGRNIPTGVHTIRLNYSLLGGVNFVSGKPELFYSALGREFASPIEKASLSLTMSPEQAAQAGHAAAYLGSFGGKKRARTAYGGGTLTVTSAKLTPGQDLVLVMPLPPGTVAKSDWQDTITQIYEASQLAVILPAGTLALLFLMWLLVGSDQHFGKTPVFTLGAPWQPPRELTPAEIGTVIDESCDDRDLVATIFDLACRGYLQIRETPNHGLVGYGNKDYEFSQPPQPVQGIMKPHEEIILNAIFSGRNKTYLSDMQGYLFDYMPLLRKQVMTTLTKDRFFARNPQSDRDYFVMLGATILAAGAALYAYSVYAADTYKIASCGIIVSGILIYLAGGFMPKRTRKGVGAVEQIHKFQHFIMHASDKEIAEADAQDPTVFFRLLPYALVLDMAELWAARFRPHIKECPPWYVSMEEMTGTAGNFNTEILVKEIIAAMHTIAHMATTRPERRASKKSSGFIPSRNLP